MLALRKIAAWFTVLFAFFSAIFSGGAGLYKSNHFYLNEPYGAQERQIYDMYLPKSAKGETGLVLLLHAGGWVMGDKDAYRGELPFWTEKGYAAAAMNYRFLSREDGVGMREILDDITSALAAIKKQASKKGIDITKVVLSGGSAGAHLALLYAYSCMEEAPVKPVAAVSHCGPTMLWDEEFIFHNEFGNYDPAFMTDLLSKLTKVEFTPETVETALPALELYSPITHVNADTVPTLLFYGMQDALTAAFAEISF
ncbi:MAG: alpha/beta hydrolase [Clostridia bacterium]|nr:alpha/beta hydrolase [Clostridia bacterium]